MIRPIFACTLAVLMTVPSLRAQSLLAVDFTDAEIKSCKDGEMIGFGNSNADHMTARLQVPNVEIRVGEAGGKHALEFVNNGTEWGQAGAVKTIPPEVGTKESLELRGTVVFTPLSVSGGRGIFQIALNSGNWVTTSSSVTAVHLSVESNLGLKYVSDTGARTVAKLEPGSRYRIDFCANFSNPQQNTWEFALSHDDGGDAAPIFSSGPLNTRAPHIVPGLFALGCGVGSGSSTEPFVQIHSVKLSEAEVAKN